MQGPFSRAASQEISSERRAQNTKALRRDNLAASFSQFLFRLSVLMWLDRVIKRGVHRGDIHLYVEGQTVSLFQ